MEAGELGTLRDLKSRLWLQPGVYREEVGGGGGVVHAGEIQPDLRTIQEGSAIS